MLNEFKSFALRGNVMDIAVGFTVGAAFGTIAKSFVDDIIMPPVGLLIGQTPFSDLFYLLKEGAEIAAPYATLADAKEAGAVTINYGLFINNIIAFLIIALVMFFIIRSINRLENAVAGDTEEESQPTTKKCPYCLSTIPHEASRCPNCTSDLETKI